MTKEEKLKLLEEIMELIEDYNIEPYYELVIKLVKLYQAIKEDEAPYHQ